MVNDGSRLRYDAIYFSLFFGIVAGDTMILAKRLYGLQGLVTVKVLMQRNFLGGDGVDEDKVESTA